MPQENLQTQMICGFQIIDWVHVYVYPAPQSKMWCDKRSIFNRSNAASFNSDISFSKISCLIKAEESSLSWNFSIARTLPMDSFPFTRALAWSE